MAADVDREKQALKDAFIYRAEFFYQRPRRDHGDHAGAAVFKNYAMEAYAQGIDWLTRLGRLDAAALLAEERRALDEERLPPLPAPSDLRRLDEPVLGGDLSATRTTLLR